MSDNTTYSTLRYTRRAKDIIMGHQTDGPQSKPLFLYLPFQAVHSPLQVSPSKIVIARIVADMFFWLILLYIKVYRNKKFYEIDH